MAIDKKQSIRSKSSHNERNSDLNVGSDTEGPTLSRSVTSGR